MNAIKSEIIEEENEAELTSFDKNDKATSEHGSQDNVPSSFVCQKCQSELKSFEEFIIYMRSEHLQSHNMEFDQRQMCPKRKSHILQHFLATKTVWKCQKCSTIFDSIRQLQEHFHNAHVDTIYRCSICLGVFAEKDHLQEHLLSMHTVQERKFKCVACDGKEFENQNHFEVHLQQKHMGNFTKPHQTKIQHELLQKSSMKKKVVKEGNSCRNFHNNVGNLQTKSTFKCIVCDIKCADQESLEKHRLHEHCKVPKAKGNTCTICRATLVDFNDFMEHSQSHNESSDEFNCIVCRQFIRSHQLLRMHGKFHLEQILNETMGEENMTSAMVECATCKENVPEEEYAKHLLLHVVNSLEGDKSNNCTPESNDADMVEQHLSCSECGKQFESMELLNAHTILHLSEIMGNSGQKLQENSSKRPSRKRNRFEKKKCCRICDKYFQSDDVLAEHVRMHNESVNNLIKNFD